MVQRGYGWRQEGTWFAGPGRDYLGRAAPTQGGWRRVDNNTARVACTCGEALVRAGTAAGLVRRIQPPMTAGDSVRRRHRAVWDAGDAKELAVLRGHKDGVRFVAFSPDGTRIITASHDQTVRVWEAASGRELAILRAEGYPCSEATFSPDGFRVVTASHVGRAQVWDAASGKILAVLRGHTAAFSPDGTRIVTASDDSTAQVWDAASGKELAVLRGHEDELTSAALAPIRALTVTARSRCRSASAQRPKHIARSPAEWLSEPSQRTPADNPT